MDSSGNHNNYDQQPSSGLLRFRSAPSSVLANFHELEDNKPAVRVREGGVNYTNTSSQGYSGLPPHYPRHSSVASSSAMDSSYGLIGSSLARQNSSPAGLLGNFSVQNGYATMRGRGDYAGANGNSEVSPRLKSQLSFPSRIPSSLGMLSQISELASEYMESSPDSRKLVNGSGGGRFYGSSGFPHGSWSDSHLGEDLNGMKDDQDSNAKLFPSTQNRELGNRIHVLSHHLSLPKSTVEMVTMEKFLHFQDSVPCKIRAKRGCATHPRSIAERVRRTRISERMRKLQELVPNMDKQTNTADMLDLAVEYIKDLQKQYKTLSDSRANCKCLSEQKTSTEPAGFTCLDPLSLMH
ncbi:hypothetical protein Tsubulata_031622 [Turnera subulata]|uniref:BHLH domain-containing protein n=1 Tax=Turnera subulata TaxID=218843 RepID=A0A9Q0FDV3_9ROSI|nr:hypothetical protein Tsubulata_031622 [Turnera subulata]